MQVSRPNEHGVLPESHRETLARRNRAHATITFALSEDGQIRYGLEMLYSYGGFAFPISAGDEGYPTLEAARVEAIEEMLRHWHRPFPSEPASVHEELRVLREEVESHLAQPSLF